MLPVKTCIIIVGPTAVGKTDIAILLSKALKTEIISADSRQCFLELNIGVAKPSPEQLSEIKHYFINSHSIREEVSAAIFEQFALRSVETIFCRSDFAIVAGGTGLYIDAFCNGLDEIPEVSELTRSDIKASYKEKGLSWLQEELKQYDPDYYQNMETENPQRLMRALEVKLSTGRSIRSYQNRKRVTRDFNIVRFGLEITKDTLYDRINSRVELMVSKGLEGEARSLDPFRNLNALNTVGYKEWFAYFDGSISRLDCIELVKKNTRHYAKRQLTWFKKDQMLEWIDPGNHIALKELLANKGIYLPHLTVSK